MEIKFSINDTELKEKFKAIKSRKDIAELLEIKEDELVALLYKKRNKYITFKLNKKTGGIRKIMAPCFKLKEIQKKLKHIMCLDYKPKRCVYGFNKGVKSNALRHLKNKILFNLDLKEFYPTIHFGRIRGLFMGKVYNFNSNVSTILAQICCHDNQLPQGAPTSPIITNMICSRMDRELQVLAKEHNCVYTRYVDDITFSTKYTRISQKIAETGYNEGVFFVNVGSRVENIITNNDFKINLKKVRIRNKHFRQEVTGIKVNTKLNIPRNFIRQVRSMLYAWEKFGIKNVEKVFFSKYYKKNKRVSDKIYFTDVLYGKINYIRMIRGYRDPIYRKLVNKYNELDGNHICLPIDLLEEIKSSLFIIESGSQTGTGFCIENDMVITCAHVIGNEREIKLFDERNVYTPIYATLVKKNTEKDIAILKINNRYVRKTLALACCDELSQGLNLTCFGYPAYEKGDQAYNIDASIQTIRKNESGENYKIALSAPLTGGYSGGPVLNEYNEVVGIIDVGAKNVAELLIVGEFTAILVNQLKGELPD